MKDFSLFNKALKLNWVKPLCSIPDAPKSLLGNVGGSQLFKCNYDIGQLSLSKCLPVFLSGNNHILAGHNSFQPKKQE